MLLTLNVYLCPELEMSMYISSKTRVFVIVLLEGGKSLASGSRGRRKRGGKLIKIRAECGSWQEQEFAWKVRDPRIMYYQRALAHAHSAHTLLSAPRFVEINMRNR